MSRRSFYVLFFIICAVKTDLKPNSQTVEYYVSLVQSEIEKALRYELPKDASMYKPNNESDVTDFGEYDFIIVGSGSAGSVLARRLSEILEWKILVLEAGDFGNNFTEIPYMYYYVQGSTYNWGFRSIPQKFSCQGMVDKKCQYPRGRGVGGSSLINGLMYVRPNRMDFDVLSQDGISGWSYDEVLSYFKKSEDVKLFNADLEFHGVGGPLAVQYFHPVSPQLETFIKASEETGLNFLDYNARVQLGAVSQTQMNIRNGRREDTGKIFVKPVLNRTNLKVQTNSYVTKILIDENNKAYGVEFSYKKKLYKALSKNEVILSAGSLQSPQLLQLSGVGPKDELNKLGIPLKRDLPVGKNLFDHATFYGITLTMDYAEPVKSIQEYVKEYLQGEGQYTITGNNQGLSFYYSNLTDSFPEVPDLEFIIVPSNGTSDYSQKIFGFTNETYENLYGYLDRTKMFKIYVILLKPKSRGSVKIPSKDPYEYPLIDSRFLEEDVDMERIYYGINIIKKLLKTKAFRKNNGTIHYPRLCKQFKTDSKEYWYCVIRLVTMNVYHPLGTCKMGHGDDAVVDDKLKVRGVNNLRVVDGSVIPNPPSSHPNAQIIMMGEKVSDIIKSSYKVKDNHLNNSW